MENQKWKPRDNQQLKKILEELQTIPISDCQWLVWTESKRLRDVYAVKCK